MVLVEIRALPEYVERTKIVEFFKSLGIDVMEVVELYVGYDSIRVTVYANDINGNRYWDKRNCPEKIAAQNVIYIPFKDTLEVDKPDTKADIA